MLKACPANSSGGLAACFLSMPGCKGSLAGVCVALLHGVRAQPGGKAMMKARNTGSGSGKMPAGAGKAGTKVAGVNGQAGLEGSCMLCRGIGLLAEWPSGRLILIISHRWKSSLPPLGEFAQF